ncbi:accessory factor UbiK family protein [Francisella sp. W12-1067]
MNCTNYTFNNTTQKLKYIMKKVLSPINDIIKNSKESILKKSLKKLDVVSREEFEVQKKILLKTRQKLESIEAKLDQLLAEKK